MEAGSKSHRRRRIFLMRPENSGNQAAISARIAELAFGLPSRAQLSDQIWQGSLNDGEGTHGMGRRREPRKEMQAPVRIFGTNSSGQVFSEKEGKVTDLPQ